MQRRLWGGPAAKKPKAAAKKPAKPRKPAKSAEQKLAEKALREAAAAEQRQLAEQARKAAKAQKAVEKAAEKAEEAQARRRAPSAARETATAELTYELLSTAAQEFVDGDTDAVEVAARRALLGPLLAEAPSAPALASGQPAASAQRGGPERQTSGAWCGLVSGELEQSNTGLSAQSAYHSAVC